MKLLKLTLAFSLFGICLQSCTPGDDQALKDVHLELPATPYSYGSGSNDQIPTLGRVLFYDNQLSVNNTVSCSSCHKQAFAFSDNAQFSRGFENKITSRNSMPIQNLRTSFFSTEDVVFFPGDSSFNGSSTTKLFWDGREHNLNTMVLRPIVNHVEMGITDVEQLAEKLRAVPYYKDLFTQAYGTDEITPDKISNALGLFLQSITSSNTKFDKANRMEDQLSALEAKGRQLFSDEYDCNSCHHVETPNGYAVAGGTFGNIGLDPIYSDSGLAAVTRRPTDVGKFKIPSLRNVVFTGPYMHDGRFESLDEVLEHYSSGIQDNSNLDPKLTNSDGGPKQMNIPDGDKQAIIAFLNTLTDVQVLADPKFSNPFKTN